MIKPEFLEQVIKQTDIVALIASHIQIKQRDPKTWGGLCPFHRDYKGTLVVSPGKRIFKCFACNKGGTH